MQLAVASYLQHESGKRAFTAEAAEQYSAHFAARRIANLHTEQGRALPPHEVLAETIYNAMQQDRPNPVNWGDRSPAHAEIYRNAADAVFRAAALPLPAARENRSSGFPEAPTGQSEGDPA